MYASTADGGGINASRGTASAARAAAAPTGGVPVADSSADVPVQRSPVSLRISVAVAGDRAILTALCHCLTDRGRRVARTVMSATSALGGLQGVARVPQCGVRGVPALLDSAVWQDLMLIGKAAR